MHPARVDRSSLSCMTDLPNVGKAVAADLRLLDIATPADLAGRCPFALYDALCARTGVRHDPCMIDVLMSLTDFMDGGAPKPWWAYTAQRKQYLLRATQTPAPTRC